MDPKDIEKLAKCLRDQGDKLLTSQFKFTLTGELLRSLNDSFSLIIDENEFVPPQMFQVTKPNNAKSNVFRELMFIYDFIQKTLVLKLTKFLEDDEDDTCVIDISKFRNLTTIEFQRIDIQRVVGLQLLRSQLQEITAERCLKNIKDLLMHCAGDNSNSFIWNSLKRADFSYNNLERIDNSFEFAPYIQHLNLSHNKIFQISALVWLPNLKNLNLSYNQLTSIPKLNVESLKRLQVLTINANLIEDLSGIIRLDALLELDLADNCLLDHQILLPLCTLNSLRYLNLSGNPLAFHPKHRSATCRYLSRNASQVQFQLDGEFLSKTEKSLSGSYENYFPLFGSRMTMSTTSSRATPSTKSRCDTPNSSLSSVNSFNITEQRTTSSQKRMRPRCVEIEESESKNNKSKLESNKRPLLKEGSKDHLITKIEIEKMREQFGNDWLHNHEDQNDAEKGTRRRLFEDIIAMSPTGSADDATIINDSNVGNETVYKTAEGSMYASALEESVESLHHEEEEPVILSDPEDNEAQFIVVDVFSKEDLFLIVTDNCIKERDAMTMRTLTKWGISTLESVERPRTCIIRLTFDTIRKDKRERQYEMEAKPCQQLERLLRDYLSTKPLSEMNQTVYKCLKCNSEFCREVVDDRKRRDNEIKCPCGNRYVVEIQKNETPTPRTTLNFTSEILKSLKTDKSVAQSSKDSASIAIESQKNEEIPKTCHSVSSIESAFDSNQSVAGSSVEVLSESSQISHVSSQSSIEVLDRKPSEERENMNEIAEIQMKKSMEEALKQKMTGIVNVNLTESSSSGSVCESVVTAYEQSHKTIDDQVFAKVSNFLFPKSTKPSQNDGPKLPESNPIQYNYEDLANVDHRVKLYLFQNVFEENDEKLSWLVKSILIDDSTYADGIPIHALTVMSTKKVYFLKIAGDENDDIQSWLKKLSSISVDRIDSVVECPSRIGLSFIFKTNSSKIHLLLRDHLLFERLKARIITSNLIRLDDSSNLSLNIKNFIEETDLKCVGIFKSCHSSIQSATDSENSEVSSKTKLKVGAIFITSDSIHVSSNFKWICDNIDERVYSKNPKLSQPMTNLVELENLTDKSFTLNFIDEINDTLEKWKFTFESDKQFLSLLRIVDEIWEKIFRLHLLNEDQLTD